MNDSRPNKEREEEEEVEEEKRERREEEKRGGFPLVSRCAYPKRRNLAVSWNAAPREKAIAPRRPPYAMMNWSLVVSFTMRNLLMMKECGPSTVATPRKMKIRVSLTELHIFRKYLMVVWDLWEMLASTPWVWGDTADCSALAMATEDPKWPSQSQVILLNIQQYEETWASATHNSRGAVRRRRYKAAGAVLSEFPSLCRWNISADR
ncbi:hypothetical protein CRUP_038501 [Coryphaenoides rupestris]|nr:hypothetical protein CRUP_038501 [Coryphaenoides rupestris]